MDAQRTSSRRIGRPPASGTAGHASNIHQQRAALRSRRRIAPPRSRSRRGCVAPRRRAKISAVATVLWAVFATEPMPRRTGRRLLATRSPNPTVAAGTAASTVLCVHRKNVKKCLATPAGIVTRGVILRAWKDTCENLRHVGRFVCCLFWQAH